MSKLVLATLLFIATHAIPAYRPLRRSLVAALGVKIYMVLYSLLSFFAIGWLGSAYFRSPYVELWPLSEAAYWVPILVMPVCCILLVAGATSRNPFSLGAGGDGFDPSRPGIVSVTRHPLMWALALWAAAHIPPNGDAAALILFSVFSGYSLLGPVSIDNRLRARMGVEVWQKLAADTSNVPLAAVLSGKTRLDWKGIGFARLAGGLLLYAALLLAHEDVIGTPPLPF